MISVVMVARNRPTTLSQALLSYTKLTYKDWELVFMDSNSTMNIKSIVESYKDRLPIRYFRQDCDPIFCPQRTYLEGFEHSVGDFVITCSADVMLSEPNMMEEFLMQYNDRRITPICFFLSQQITMQLNMLDWFNNPKVIQEQSDFWTDKQVGQTNAARIINKSWEITTYLTGMSRDRWKWLGLWRNEEGYNFSDQDIVQRENCLGVRGKELENYCVYHQCHLETGPVGAFHAEKNRSYAYHNENQARLLEPAERLGI